MGKKASSRHISEVGNYGDEREFYASRYVLEHAPPNDPDAVIGALEEFDVRWTMLHLGREKGEFLDRAVEDVVSERWKATGQRGTMQREDGPRVRALEIGAYIGYSAIRIGRILAAEGGFGSTLLSVEQNEDNAGYAKVHVEYSGLGETVTVLRSRIENCFDDDESSSTEAGATGVTDETTGNNNRPYDFVFLDHRKPFYLRDLKLLESRGAIDSDVTTVVADNVGSLEHVRNREEAIARGKRKGPCRCVNKACDYLEYVKRRWSSTELFYGDNTKDGISVSKPLTACALENRCPVASPIETTIN